jgi:hypothetical protein
VKLRLTFEPIVIEVPDDFYDPDADDGTDGLIDYVNENWSELVDPSMPPLAEVEVLK